ncbi:MAG TPA: group II intron reverse transcriptase/maturase [Ruminiclostridium sp.]
MDKRKPYEISRQQVMAAYKMVKANKGAAGVDGIAIKEFDADLKNNLYKLWNRMSSGSYFPMPVKGVEIPKKSGGKRLLGIPTVADRIGQMVALRNIEPLVEPVFFEDSYGYRPNKSAIDAVGVTRERCWKYDWLIEFDIIGLFDNIDHEFLMKVVRKHTDNEWVILYIKRWLKVPFLMPEVGLVERTSGTPQGGVISPVLANLFMHYAFDKWMKKENPCNPWARYADDGVIHCKTEEEANQVLEQLKRRMIECKLELHPEKTRIVYCKDSNRTGEHEHTSFDFLGYTYRTRFARSKNGKYFASFSPAVSKKACNSFNERIRDIRRRTTFKSLEQLALDINPVMCGWANYFGCYNKSEMKHNLAKVNLALVVWARYKYKKVRSEASAWKWLKRCASTQPDLFVHWKMGLRPAT